MTFRGTSVNNPNKATSDDIKDLLEELRSREPPNKFAAKDTAAHEFPPPKFYPCYRKPIPSSQIETLIRDLDRVQIRCDSSPLPSSTMTFRNNTQGIGKRQMENARSCSEYKQELQDIDHSLSQMITSMIEDISETSKIVDEGLPQSLPFSVGPYDPSVDIRPRKEKQVLVDMTQFQVDVAAVEAELKALHQSNDDQPMTPKNVGVIEEAGQTIPLFELKLDDFILNEENQETTDPEKIGTDKPSSERQGTAITDQNEDEKSDPDLDQTDVEIDEDLYIRRRNRVEEWQNQFEAQKESAEKRLKELESERSKMLEEKRRRRRPRTKQVPPEITESALTLFMDQSKQSSLRNRIALNMVSERFLPTEELYHSILTRNVKIGRAMSKM
ncbi:hypothetical protein BLNAU_3765 [Blattamonas nauphoetae]|uniref:Uncharacterized protein n=1 Tax=Blattamonas nauphoetae TaxID=2049346 RepID=A0ABQ9YC58_9EUKA|nr:hypothetical protein BLNAU_3765 [Blattamonas nauphoetae]